MTAKVFAQLRDWERPSGAPNGTIKCAVMYRFVEPPETSAVTEVTVSLSSQQSLAQDIQNSLASTLGINSSDIVLIGA